MGYNSFSATSACTSEGCRTAGRCLTGACQKMEVYDWLAGIPMPAHRKAFPIIEVKFKGGRKEFFTNHGHIPLLSGDLVVVEGATGGYDVGHVSLTGELVRLQLKHKKTSQDQVSRKLYRKANEADIEKWKLAKSLEYDAMHRTRKMALSLGLSMKISDVDYQGDNTKATFYYTADGRVDFRELIKKMAEAFRVRIEMRQIGMRQEASRLGGIDSGGRELSCATWMNGFKTVSTAAARYQNLSINTSKLAGQCGKLKCSLNFELDTYLDALRDIPEKVDVLHTENGPARLQKTDIFKKIMWFSYANQEEWIPLKVARVREIIAMNRKGDKPANLNDDAVVLKPAAVVEKTPDYENVVGQDSLTRLDDRNKKNRKNKGKDRPKGQPKSNEHKQELTSANENKQIATKEDAEAKGQQKQHNRNRNRNRNKGKRPNPTAE